ncbi:MAG: CRTAC1 family protein [Acidimicrobiia bacterium]|nr:CRTAC1 family protein [Acidimicrobiia bacterium]
MWLTLLLAAALPIFQDVTPESGIGFRHDKSPTTRKYLIESVTGGVAMIDYDSDGRLDLYFVNGAALTDPMNPSQSPDKSSPKFWNRLYRNMGGFRFEDVTEKAGLRGRGYGMGAAAGDYDSDGRVDLYVTNFGANILYRNRGDGTLEDVTEKAGVKAGGWSTSAAWADFDSDGYLDLIVARYVKWDFQPDIWCGSRQEGYRSYCHPDQFQPITHILYRNRGDGSFEDVTEKSGWRQSPGKGLGIALNDFDRDGKIDIVVANDSFPQQLFRNLGGGRFREMGLEAGIAYDEDGRVFGGMGVDFADYDNDGWPDIFINALAMQRYALFRNLKGLFEYASPTTNVGRITRMRSGWGTKFIDYDNDGWRDLFVAQGHVMDNIQLTQPSLTYLEPPLLMRNAAGKFEDVSSTSGEIFSRPLAARGAAFGDLDNDGWIDIVINCNNGSPVILRNRGGNANHWLTIDAAGVTGTRVRIVGEDGREQRAILNTTGSYLSANDPRVHFGLGAAATAKLVEVEWPNGVVTRRENVPANQILPISPPLRP